MDPGNLSNVPGEDPVSTEPPPSLKPPQPTETKVRVAVRVRPFISKEVADNEQPCVTCFGQTNQIVIGKDKTFSFDSVFDSYSRQSEVFESCARDLVASCLAGYNATILAYGQTGSGKTYTMGSNTTYETNDPGIIPRVMRELFNEIDKRRVKSEFILKVSFLEIYNEEIQDLLDTTTARFRYNQSSYFNKNPIAIREEKDGSISVYGAREEKVGSYDEMTAYLEKGSLHRSTASTMMNESSSRSHAIFTISVEQHQIDDLYKKNVKAKSSGDSNFTMAKFHFVDLAGSERIKKTGASGAILREGININRGLLALGNVISALTDLSGKVSHVPYRESKLTRILQDSLGGNSRTVMIACISPAESNFDESLNTLKYASRARNIRNKPIVNRDPQSTLVSQLKQQIFELQGQLMAYKRAAGSPSKENFGADSQLFGSMLGSVSFAEHNQIETVKEEVKDLKIKVIQYEKELAILNTELQQTKALLNQNEISVYSLQKDRDLLKLLNEKYKKVLADNNIVVPSEDSEAEELERVSLVEEYSKTIEKLRHELRDKDKLNEEMHREYESLMKENTRDQQLLLEKTKFIQTLMSKIRLLEMPALPIDISTPKSDITQTFEMATARSEAFPQFERITEEFNMENMEEEDRMEREFLATSHLHKNEMLLVDGNLNEKEELLKNMTKNQYLLEKGLMDEMKNQYYKKIQNLENELKYVERQRDEALSKITSTNVEGEKNRILAASKQKITDLEVKIKEFRKKEKEQTSLGKLVESQRTKINQLDDEIKKIKTQKIQLQKKIKEEAEKHDKWKSTREKELFEAKKMNLEKDLVISKLKTESRKKEFAYKKKADELLSKYMSKELLGQIQSESKGRRKKKNLSNSLMVEDLSNLSFDENQNLAITEEEAKQLLEYCGERMLEHLQISYQIEREEENIKKTEEELEIERHKQAELLLKRDRAELDRKNSIKDLDLEQNLSLKVQEYDLDLNEISTRIEALEGKLDFQLNKANQLTDELTRRPKVSPEQILLNNERMLKNPGNMKLILRCLFGKYIGANLDILKLHEKMGQIAFDMTEMRKRMEETERRAKLNELQYEINLTKLTKEYERNQLVLLKQDSYDENEELNAEDDEPEEAGQDEAMSPLASNINKGPDQINLERTDSPRRSSAMLITESPPKKRGPVSSASGSKGKAIESVADQNKKLDKMVKDLTRKQAISDKLIEDLKRKNAILQTKYDQMKKTSEKPAISKNASDDISQLRTGNGNINSIATDRSQYSTSTSMSINASFSVGTPSTARKPDDGEVSSRQRQDKSAKDLLNLSSLRDKRKEENKNKQGGMESSMVKQGQDGDKAKSEAMTKSGTRKSVAKGPVKRAESPKRQNVTGQTDTTARKVGSQTDSIEESKGDNSATKDTANEESLKTSFDEEIEESTDWKCHATIEAAHTSPILCVTSLGNMLYSSDHKTFKVWSLDTLTCISEIVVRTSSAKSIKAMTIWPEKNLLATSYDKTVSLWDLVSLQNVGTLKGHKDEIKALTVCDNLLLSGGKGSATQNALLAWDLRAPGPVEEKEKDQEIVSMIAHNGILYYGNQEHQIRSVNLTTMQSLAPFEPRHKDVVSSLAIIQDQLVSASKDGTLNLWNLNHHILNLKHTATLPKSYVTTLECKRFLLQLSDQRLANRAQDLLYSGTRSGLIKIWNVDDEKLNCLGTLKGHKQSVNSICKLYDEYETMFASASSDKLIKIWKPTGEEDSDLTIKNADSMNKSQGIDLDE